MLVYRIEIIGKNHTGFYGIHTDRTDATHDYSGPKCPGPSKDGIKEFKNGWRFGFASMELLEDWFILDKVREIGKCQLVTYQIRKNYIIFGKKQLIFDPSKAIILKEEPLVHN